MGSHTDWSSRSALACLAFGPAYPKATPLPSTTRAATNASLEENIANLEIRVDLLNGIS